MGKIKLDNTIAIGSSLLMVVAPKVCCWSAVIAAVSGGSSYLAWVYPMGPYLMGIAGIALSYSFYKAYKPIKDKAPSSSKCSGCNSPKKGFFQSKLYVWLILVFVLGSFAVSYFK